MRSTAAAPSVAPSSPAPTDAVPPPSEDAPVARHVVIFLADTLRADRVPPLASPRLHSPGLSRLARGSVVFERAYAPSNWTKPSVASLLTGLTPRQHGAITHEAKLGDEHRLLTERLSDAGYYVAGVVTNGYVSTGYGFGRGWDRLLHSAQSGRSRGELVVEDVERVLRERPVDRPLFLYVHTTDVHAPYAPPRLDLERYDSRAYDGPVDFARSRLLLDQIARGQLSLGARDRERLVALYDGAVTYHDRQLARMLAALERAGILDEALVVFASDHGEELFEHGSVSHGGQRLFEELVRVPLVISHPGASPARRAAAVSLLDVVPTVLDAIGLPPDPTLAGRSLLDAAVGERPILLVTDQLSAVIDGRHKLVRADGDGRARLFDLVDDPGELRDLARERPEDVERLTRLLRELGGHGRAGAATNAELDESTRARLRELGYIR